MQTSMNPIFTGERAMHFLQDTVVHSMEGVLFVLLSTLFTLAGGAIFLEDSVRGGRTGETIASVPAAPTVTVVAPASPAQVAAIQPASYLIPAR